MATRLKGRPPYVLRRRAAAEKTTAEVMYYRHLQSFLEGKYRIHHVFGETVRHYAQRVSAAAADLHDVDFTAIEEGVHQAVAAWERETNLGALLMQSIARYQVVIEMINQGEFDRPEWTEPEMQQLFKSISESIPYLAPCPRKRDQR